MSRPGPLNTQTAPRDIENAHTLVGELRGLVNELLDTLRRHCANTSAGIVYLG